MKTKLKPRNPKSKSGRKSKIVLRVSKPTAQTGWNLKCRKCGADAISYYRHAMWFYPDDYEGKTEIWGYCEKHRDVVFATCPIDVKMSFTKSAGSQGYVDFDNRIIVGDTEVKATGMTAKHLLNMRGWPSVRDMNYDKMLDKDYEKMFLIYDGPTGKFKRSFTEYGKAVGSIDNSKKEVLVYYAEIKNEEEQITKALCLR